MPQIFLGFIVSFLWANAYIVKKHLVYFLPPYLLLTLQGSILGICALIICPRPPLPIKRILLLSFVWGILTEGALMTALKLGINVSVAVVIGKLNVLFGILLAFLFYNEKINSTTLIGITISLIGTGFLLNTTLSGEAFLPIGLLLVFCFFWGIYNVLIKKSGRVNSIYLALWVPFMLAPQTFFISWLFEDWPDLSELNSKLILPVMYLSLSRVVSAGLWFFLLQRYPMQKLAVFVLLVPVIGNIEAVLFFNEHPSLNHFISMLLILVGTGIALTNKKVVHTLPTYTKSTSFLK